MSQKCFEEKHVDLLLIGQQVKRHYILIKDFNTSVYDYTLNRERIHFCCYYLQTISTEKILKRYVKVCFKINGKKITMMPKKDEYVYDLCRVWKYFSTGR